MLISTCESPSSNMRTFGQRVTFFRCVIGFSSSTINRGITMWTYFHLTKSFLVSAGQYKGKGSVLFFQFSHLVWRLPPLLAHPEKCCWEPTQVGDLLGFTLNLKEGTIHVPPERIARLRERITLVSNGNPTTRLAAALVEMVVSMGLALGPVSRLWTRALYRDSKSAEFWSQRITLSPAAAREVKFWKDSFPHYNGRPIWDADPKIDITSHSDASDTGWGGGGVTA